MIMSHKSPLLPRTQLALIFFTAALLCSPAAEFALKTIDKEPPPEIAPAIRSLLQPKAVQLLQDDKPLFEYWLVNNVTVTTNPGETQKHLDSLKPITLLGAVALHKDQRDYRDDEIYKGIYTVRFALQPQDGNHLGTADFPYFAALIPAKLDAKVEGFATPEAMVKASSKESSTGHPFILSLRPVSSSAGDAPSIHEAGEDHKTLRVKLPAATPTGEKSDLFFDIVFVGKAKA